MRGRVVTVDAAAEDGDRRAAGLQSSAVRFSVDTSREPADDDDARRGELPAEEPRHLRAVGRARPRADDGDGLPSQRPAAGGSAHEETGRRVVNRPQERREIRVGAREPAHAVLPQATEIRAFVERAGERAKDRIAPWLPHEVPVRLGRERGQREIAHAVPSSVGER